VGIRRRVGDNGDGALELRVVNPAYDGDDPAEALTFERGDDVRIELTNVSNREVSVGNHGKYNVEVLTEEGGPMSAAGTTASSTTPTRRSPTHPARPSCGSSR